MWFKSESLQYVFFLVLIKLVVSSVVALILIGSSKFSTTLLIRDINLKNKFKIIFFLGFTALLLVILRRNAGYHAMDISVVLIFLSGLIAGFLPALTWSIFLSFILIVWNGEYYSALAIILASVVGSIFRKIGFWITDVHKSAIGMLFISLSFLLLNRYFPSGKFFNLSNENIGGDFLFLLSDYFSIFLILFVWKHRYTKVSLINSEKNLNEARLAVLSSKINPHFLFNTLNTIISAIRTNPVVARNLVFKLSEIMRYVLKVENNFVSLREELDLIKNYLEIEETRFGRNKLEIVWNIEKNIKNLKIPTMLLQPIVENAVKHGIMFLNGKKGLIKITAFLINNTLLKIEIFNNGISVDEPDEVIFKKGVGLSNTRDRINLLYREKGKCEFISSKNKGTTVSLYLPVNNQ